MKTQGDKKNKIVSNVLIAVFAFSAMGATYYAYDQYNQKTQMQEQFGFQKTGMEQHLIKSFEQIEQNLAQINEHEGKLQLNLEGKDMEGVTSPEERIQREISLIESLIAENKQIINELTGKVGSQHKELAAYNNKVLALNKRVKSYKAESEDLLNKNRLLTAGLQTVADENAELTLQNEKKLIEIESKDRLLIEKENKLNTVYYVSGSYDALKDAEIIEKEGGIIGIAATKTLKDDFNKNEFIEVDKRNYKTIPVFSKKAELISKHNKDSYEWIKEGNEIKWIKITNPDLFWESGKYLVIETNENNGLSLADNK